MKKIRYSLLGLILHEIKLSCFRKKWWKKNAHNDTIPMNNFGLKNIRIGKATYGELTIIRFNHNSSVVIGNYTSIAQQVTFLLDADHRIDTLMTFPHKVKTLHTEEYEAVSKGDIIVEDDVWIGYGATIMSGVHIGQGAVVAAGSVVTKDVPPYSVVGGVPARIIKYRFSQDIIEKLLEIDYSQLDEEMIKEHIEELYQQVDEGINLGWLPRRERAV